MVFDIDKWVAVFLTKLQTIFGNRIVFAGLQGSFQRGEASAESDIDMAVILDSVSVQDLKKYRQAVSEMPDSERACGFLSGKVEFVNWPKGELFQFYHDTKPLIGNLDDLMPVLSANDIRIAVTSGAANLYHAACHSFIYDKEPVSSLPAFVKGTFFILQAKHMLDAGIYIKTKKELVLRLTGTDRKIMELCLQRDTLAGKTKEEADLIFQELIGWCGKLLDEYKQRQE